MRKTLVAPSILAADFSCLKDDVQRMKLAGVEYLHYDVMDGHFVPNISFGPAVVKSITSQFAFIHDVHLMIENPEQYFSAFIQAGASIITFHYEVASSLEQIKSWIQLLHQHDVKAGISIKPNTPIDVLFPIIDVVDLILVMSVEPGFGGQKFNLEAIDKIKQLRSKINQAKHRPLISVDGGINDETGNACIQAGVDILVAGSYLFGHKDWRERLKKLSHE
jgi:ribulose-phosphate 3-epimerase